MLEHLLVWLLFLLWTSARSATRTWREVAQDHQRDLAKLHAALRSNSKFTHLVLEKFSTRDRPWQRNSSSRRRARRA
jgi:hypothetical protein